MVSITAIGAAAASLNAAVGIAKAMIGVRDGAMIQSKVIELQSVILDAQSSIFAANDERAALIEKVRELEEEVARMKAWETEKQRYELQSIPPGVFVYVLKPSMAQGEPPHQICQTCYHRGKKSILHSSEAANGLSHLRCHECGSDLKVGLFSPPPQRTSWGPRQDY